VTAGLSSAQRFADVAGRHIGLERRLNTYCALFIAACAHRLHTLHNARLQA
jgi:hypothetical protein